MNWLRKHFVMAAIAVVGVGLFAAVFLTPSGDLTSPQVIGVAAIALAVGIIAWGLRERREADRPNEP